MGYKNCSECTIGCIETIFETKVKYQSYLDDVVMATFWYEKMTETYIEENVAYTFDKFISNFGGTVGLVMGLSFMSLFEVTFCVSSWIMDKIHAWRMNLKVRQVVVKSFDA